ncbi:HIT family protein [candidate division WWE3 bacterium]|nr:HIT family protein [candidate division WWE3 bacterium]
MKYKEYLTTITTCTFCEGVGARKIFENNFAFLTYSISPYHKHHILVIPKRHVEYMCDLTWDEHVKCLELVVLGIKCLGNLGHNDCTLLLRDGKAQSKSVAHLHFNIIPNARIEDISINFEDRTLLTDSEKNSIVAEIQKAAKALNLNTN